MIPKKIHYCWFGQGEKPKLAQKCIESWKRHCPDYEFVEWNEKNFDIHMNPYTEWCYKEKKFAFLSDYVRLWAVYKEGGIYLDIDVELIRSIDVLRENKAYFGFETEEYVNTGLGFGAEKKSDAVKHMLDAYDVLLDGKHGTIGCPTLNTQALIEMGMIRNGAYQTFEAMTILPQDYLNPYDDPTGRLNVTENTYSIHWYMKSPHGKATVLRSKLMRPLHRLLGKDFFRKFRKK